MSCNITAMRRNHAHPCRENVTFPLWRTDARACGCNIVTLSLLWIFSFIWTFLPTRWTAITARIIYTDRLNILEKIFAKVKMTIEWHTYLTHLDCRVIRFSERFRWSFGFACRGSADLPGRLPFTSGCCRLNVIIEKPYTPSKPQNTACSWKNPHTFQRFVLLCAFVQLTFTIRVSKRQTIK